MLTKKALRERKWGPYPALRKALDDKRIPEGYYGPTSVSDSIFSALDRLIEIAILAREHEGLVRETAQAVGPGDMYWDLQRLQTELEAACSFLEQQAEGVRTLCSKL